MVAAAFDPHLSGRRIQEFVELIYLSEGTLSERMDFALDKRKNPYPAQFGALDGVRWEGQIYCGHNPYLFARLVDDLRVQCDEHGKERAIWTELREAGY